MYSSSRGGSAAYGGGQQQQQQPYTSQSAYSQNLGTPYSVGGADGGSQLSLASRHSSMLGGPKESDITGYRGHPSAGAHYGGQYTSVYGSAALGSGQKIPGMSGKGAASTALEGRTGYGSTIPDSPKFTSGDYVSSSSHGYGQKNDPLLSDKTYDHPSMDRRQYGERQSAYVGRDLQNVPTSRYGDSISFGRQHQPDMYDRMDQTSLLRQEQLLKAQSLQSASIDGGSRQADYLATRGSSIHHSAQELMSYGGRTDADPRSISYGAQPAPSILGAAPQRNMDDLIYGQNSSNPGYGVSLPPGRDYATGKGLHGVSLDSDYPGSLLSRGAYPRIDELKDDRIGYSRELDRREEERRRDLLREREKERDREKARERERERERDRDRERKRERERERERLERREKERERDRARGLEARRERSLSRISKDRAERGGSSLTKDIRPTRLDSPRHEASHRRPSPVREKRREYVCKVYSSKLVEIERDYLSLDKRYPRLFISPQCSKVVVNWPKENLRLSLHTPVSFEHGFVGENTRPEQKEPPSIPSANEPVKSESRTIVWNAKMILMSGLSQNALEELSSERSYDDRVPHYCNMLRFAVLKNDNALMAIGGPWDTVDGGDPSVDDSSLVQTVLRYAKDVTQLDLKNCKHWNRFLEIHYDRVGKDGLFSHKEVTVLFVPDLSDCLPSLEAWRDQWIAHMKAIAERASQLAQKKEKSKEKKGGMKDKEIDSRNKENGNGKSEKIAESASSGQAVDINNTQKDDHEQKAKAAVKEGDKNEKLEKMDGTKASGGTDVQKEDGGSVGVQVAGSGKTGKKKIIKKVIKQKVTDKKEVLEDSTKVSDKVDEKNVGENKVNLENSAPQNEPSASAAGVKTFVRKKVVKKVPVAKVVQNESPGTQTQLKTEGTEDKADSGADLLVQDATTKKVAKKKIIKRVPKRKVTPVEAKNVVGNTTKDDEKVKTGQAGSEAKSVAKLEENITSKSVTPEKSGNSSVTKSKVEKEDKVDERRDNEKIGKGEKSTEKEKSKDDEKKDKKGRDESKSKPNKEVKDKKKPEEPPRHPGLFLQTKRGKDPKLRSVSLSLDSLLDYTDKDIDESTYELSLFAESLHEMLQYQMGSRLLTFLQKLRLKFVMKRNQRKRQRDEISKDSDKKSSTKRLKTDKATTEDKSTKTETDDAARADDGKAIVKEEGNSVDGTENVKQEDGTDVDDPEEDPDEDEEMLDESSQQDLANEENAAGEKIDAVIKSKEEVGNSDDKKQETLKENADSKPKTGSTSNENEEKTGTKTKETEVVDKELLQAFRFFDRNRVGYIRVEDMRLIIHNLGKFLSHRDVKELVQSALLESNTGRDDRILYPKLVRMAYV